MSGQENRGREGRPARIALEALRQTEADRKRHSTSDASGQAELAELARSIVLNLVARPRERRSSTRRLRSAASRAAHLDMPLHELAAAVTGGARDAWNAVAGEETGAEVAARGEAVFTALEAAVAALAEAYADADRDIAATQAEQRRALVDELLVMPPSDRLDALRRRRRAERHGLSADERYRVTLISAGRRHTDAAVESMIGAIRRSLGTTRPPRGLTFALPEVIEWRGRAVVLDLANEDRNERVRRAFETAFANAVPAAWVAVAGTEVGHVDLLAASMEQLREAVRTAERVGRTGWIANAEELDLETLLSLDDGLRSRAVIAELGPILDDARLGSSLVETLNAYFAAGHNAHETARQLHIAPRTVAYRLQRVEDLLGHTLDDGAALRLSVALFAYHLGGYRSDAKSHARTGAT